MKKKKKKNLESNDILNISSIDKKKFLDKNKFKSNREIIIKENKEATNKINTTNNNRNIPIIPNNQIIDFRNNKIYQKLPDQDMNKTGTSRVVNEKILECINRKNSRKENITFNKFTLKEKFFRILFCFRYRINQKMLILNEINNIYLKKYSFEHFANISREMKLLKLILLEDYQKNLIKCIPLPLSNNKEKINYKNNIDKLNFNIGENRIYINHKIKNLILC